MTVKQAIERIAKELKKDDGYYFTWQSNIAMAYQDAESHYKTRHGIMRLTSLDKHHVANEAAQNFISVCFKVKPRNVKP